MNSIERIINKINRNIIEAEDIEGITRVIRSGFLSRPAGGPMVVKFQEAIALMHSKKYAYATTSGTASLHLAVSSLSLKKGDEVIVPALANIADCSVLIQEGLTPVFADVNPKTFNIDPIDIERKITSRTKAIIVVHMYGEPVNIKSILRLKRKYRLILIEDCAQAAGAKINGRYVGSFGDISCFSFYQTKHIVMGEGGILLTNNKQWFNKIDSLANNGIIKRNLDKYNYDLVGYNYQMTEMQAVLGIAQLRRLDRLNKVRRANAEIYREQLKDLGISFQESDGQCDNAYFYLTGILPTKMARKRNLFLDNVRRGGVPIKCLYPLILPETRLLKGKVNNDCPVAKCLAGRLFNVYVNPGLERGDIIGFCRVIVDEYNKLLK